MKSLLKIFAACILVAFLGGCATFGQWGRKPIYPTDLTGEMKQTFSLAENNYFNGRFNEAERLYQNYISSYGYNELTDEAKFKLGEINFVRKKYKDALTYYKEAFENLYNPEIAPKAQFKAALTLHKLRRDAQALTVLEGMQRRDMTSLLALRTDSLAINLGKQLRKERDDIIMWYLFLLDDYDSVAPSEYQRKVPEKLVPREVAHREVVAWVRDANVSRESVESLPLKDMKRGSSGGYVLYKLALINFAHGNTKEATKYLRKFVRSYPKHEFASDGIAMLAEFKGKVGGRRLKIGVILPLSGRFGLYGNSTLHGIQCAAGLTPPCTSPYNIELVVKDSYGSASSAETAVEELAKEKVLAIIGPLLSSTVGSAARKAQELRIPLVSLSQKAGIAETGNFVFKHALTPDDQVNTLVEYAVGRRKKRNFGILHPENSYGTHFTRLFSSAVRSAGGKVVYQKGYSHQDLKAYKPGSMEMSGAEVISGSYVEGMGGSFEVPSNVDALFIPDSYKAVGFVVAAMHTESEKLSPSLLLLGVNRWNNPGLLSQDMGLLNGSVFVDGFYKRSADVTTRHFVQNFSHAFGMDPTILEAQGFDALKIVMSGVSGGGTNRIKLSESILRINNLGGATGSINIDANGNSHRRLFILTVKKGGIAELSSSRIPVNYGTSSSKTSKKMSDAKYEGDSTPDLSVRTDHGKYDTDDVYTKELE